MQGVKALIDSRAGERPCAGRARWHRARVGLLAANEGGKRVGDRLPKPHRARGQSESEAGCSPHGAGLVWEGVWGAIIERRGF